jgi:cobalt-zinc-cadmium efflux system membrane fusion protein
MKRLAALALLLSLGAACQRAPTPGAPAPTPPGEVWLTDAQMHSLGVQVQEVHLEDVDDTIRAAGKIAFDDAHVSHVYSPVSGRVTKIHAQLGQRVKKGEPLVTIESPDVGMASADLSKADADLEAARHEFDRKQDLYAHHAASQADFEAAEDSWRKAKAEVDRAKLKVRLLRTGAFDAVTQTYTALAEIDGEVVMRSVSPGMEVQGQYGGGSPLELFTLGEADEVWAVAELYEMDLPRVSVGSKAQVHAVTYPNRIFEGKIDWVAGMLDPTTRTAKVRVRLPNADRALKPEMLASVVVSVDRRRTLAVPRSAVVRLGERTVVFVERGAAPDGRHRFERVAVDVDETEGTPSGADRKGEPWIPVGHGLAEGQRVAVSGVVAMTGQL